jgi:hypothetical protein
VSSKPSRLRTCTLSSSSMRGAVRCWADRASAVVLGWYPGQEDGTVTAGLFGDAEPGEGCRSPFPPTPIADVGDRAVPGRQRSRGLQRGAEVGYRHYLLAASRLCSRSARLHTTFVDDSHPCRRPPESR